MNKFCVRWKGKLVLLITLLFVLINVGYAVLPVYLSDQGTDVKDTTGTILVLGNLTVRIYDASSGGNLIYEQNFTDAIVNGSWNIMLNESLNLEFGKKYWKDYLINEDDLSFDGADRLAFYSPLGDISSEDLNLTNITLSTFTNDAGFVTSAAGMDYTNVVLSNDSSTLNETWDVTNYTAGDGNLTITSHVISLVYTELKDWFDLFYQPIGTYLTSTQINESYVINTTLSQYDAYNYNMSRDEFFYNQTTPAETYADNTFLPSSEIDDYVNWSDGNRTYAQIGSDTNASTACSTTEVLLGNGSCQDSSVFFDDTNTDDLTNVAFTNQSNTFTESMIIQGNLTIIGSYVNATVENQYLNGSFLPDIDDLFDLGSSVFRWANVYVNKIYSNDWSNVTITEDQISDLGGYVASAEMNSTYAVNESLDQYMDWVVGNATFAQYDAYNYNMSRDEFFYNQTTPAETYADNTFLKLIDYVAQIVSYLNITDYTAQIVDYYNISTFNEQIVDYVNWSDGNRTYVEIEGDTMIGDLIIEGELNVTENINMTQNRGMFWNATSFICYNGTDIIINNGVSGVTC